MIIPKNTFHFSVDDVFDCLLEVSDKKIPLFQQSFFKFLKSLHEEFGVSIGLHLFYQKDIKGKLRTLSEIVDLKNHLENINWLFFAPHALEYNTPPYSQIPKEQIDTFEKIYKQIDRIAGRSKYSRFVRLQYYSESYELADYFKSKGVQALFTTDREVGSHRMPKNIAKKLLNKGYAKYKEMNFIRTQFRVEFFVEEEIREEEAKRRMQKALEKYGFVVFYTHEIDMEFEKGRKMANLMCNIVRQLGLVSVNKA